MIRLFVGLELPAPVRDRLVGLAGGIPGATWVPAENLHLTLRFLGEVEPHRAEDADAALALVPLTPFALVLAGVGQFATGGRPRSLWAGVEDCPPLHQLQARIARALAVAGFAADERKFSPHITLARLGSSPIDRIGRFLAAHNLLRLGPVPIGRFTLFESLRTRNGPSHYRIVRYYPNNEEIDTLYDHDGLDEFDDRAEE